MMELQTSFTESWENDSSAVNVQSKPVTPAKKAPCSGNVKVCVRIRPMEQCEEGERCWKQEPDLKTLCETRQFAEAKEWKFDRVFEESCTTEAVYKETIQDLVDPVLDGIHGTALVYGQTSSGKTHTMFGTNCIKGVGDTGAVQLALKDLFNRIEMLSEHRDFTVEISYVEVYNEIIGDLLSSDGAESPDSPSKSRPSTPVLIQRALNTASSSSPRPASPFSPGSRSGSPFRPGRGNAGSILRSRPVTIRDDPDGGMSLTSTRKTVKNFGEALHVLKEGAAQRHISSTGLNERSSRSHTIFTLHVTSINKESRTRLQAQLNLVDLAGSESMRTSNASGFQVQEAKSINQSLLSLALVISKLVEAGGGQQSSSHIAFRNSKLTRILKPALCGDSLVSIICCITPAKQFIEETRNTLQFARTARMVKVNAKVHESIAPEQIIAKLQKELKLLRSKLATSSTTCSCSSNASAKDQVALLLRKRMETDAILKQLRGEVQRKDEQIARLKNLLIGSVLSDSQFEEGSPSPGGLLISRRGSDQWSELKATRRVRRHSSEFGTFTTPCPSTPPSTWKRGRSGSQSFAEIHNTILVEKVTLQRAALEEERNQRREHVSTLREALYEAQGARLILEERCSRLDTMVEANVLAFREIETSKVEERQKIQDVLDREREQRESAQEKLDEVISRCHRLESTLAAQKLEIEEFEEKLHDKEEGELSLQEVVDRQNGTINDLETEKLENLNRMNFLEQALAESEKANAELLSYKTRYEAIVCSNEKPLEAASVEGPKPPTLDFDVLSCGDPEFPDPGTPSSGGSFCTAQSMLSGTTGASATGEGSFAIAPGSTGFSISAPSSLMLAVFGSTIQRTKNLIHTDPLSKWYVKKQVPVTIKED